MSRFRSGPSTTLYIRNISDRVRYDDMKRLFSKYGRVLDITIPLDYYSGMPKGFCFVEFDDPRDAEEAQYRMDRQRLFGREIEVEFARGERKTPGEMRNRDRGGRYPRREYDRRDDHDRRSRSVGRDRERRRMRSRSRSREERSRSRRSRSYSKNRTPSPKARSVSRDRSVSRERSISPKRNERSPKSNGNMSRSPSPAS